MTEDGDNGKSVLEMDQPATHGVKKFHDVYLVLCYWGTNTYVFRFAYKSKKEAKKVADNMDKSKIISERAEAAIEQDLANNYLPWNVDISIGEEGRDNVFMVSRIRELPINEDANWMTHEGEE